MGYFIPLCNSGILGTLTETISDSDLDNTPIEGLSTRKQINCYSHIEKFYVHCFVNTEISLKTCQKLQTMTE